MACLEAALLWSSANITINNLAVALVGPLVYNLGFADSATCNVVGSFLPSLPTAYMSIWGAQSENRTMVGLYQLTMRSALNLTQVVVGFFMGDGDYPAKLCSLLNIILMVGYGTIDCIIGGQVLSAVSGEIMTIAVGVVIVVLAVCIFAAFGLNIFHLYERYVHQITRAIRTSRSHAQCNFAWLPQLVVLLVLVGVAHGKSRTALESTGSASDIAANRLSFLSLMFYVPSSWAEAASDFYVYYPPNTSSANLYLLTLTGLTLSFSFVTMIDVGLGCGMASNPVWETAYNISIGAVVEVAYRSLEGFGNFCAVIVAFGPIANDIFGTFAGGLGCQIMGRYGKAVPRYVWVLVIMLISSSVVSLVATSFLLSSPISSHSWPTGSAYWYASFSRSMSYSSRGPAVSSGQPGKTRQRCP